jgi:hypothetical protein
MTALYPIQDTFVRGEVSPRLHARASLDLYRAALATCENFITLPHGGIRKRGGTYFAGEVKTSSKKTRLIPFIFSADQAYALEVGDLYIRVYAYGQRVGTVEVVTPWAEADIWDLSFYQSADVMWICHGSYAPRTLTREGATTWTLATFEVDDGPYLEINTTSTTLSLASTGHITPVMIDNTTPAGYTASSTNGTASAYQAFDRNRTQSVKFSDTSSGYIRIQLPVAVTADAYWVVGDNLVATSGNDTVTAWEFQGSNDGSTWTTLDSRPSEVGWTSSEVRFYEFQNQTPYLYYQLDTRGGGGSDADRCTIAEIAIHQRAQEQTPFNLVASATTGINGGAGFVASDVGRHIRLLGSDNRWRWAKIAAYTSSTVVTVRIYGHALPDLSPITNWRLGAWCDQEGWPDSVGLYEERLIFSKERRINGSKTGDFDNFALGEKDDDGLEFLQAGGGLANEIVWVADSDGALVIATAGGMRSLSGSGLDEALTPSSFKNKSSRTAGAVRRRPVDAGRSFMYIGRSRRSIHELVSDQTNRFSSSDIGTISEHIPKKGVVEIDYQEDPDPVLWFPLDTGELGGYTHQPDESVRGMHRHVIGGSFGSGIAVVESCIVTPGQDAPDDVWLIVKRTISGTTKRYIEVMQPAMEYGQLQDVFCVDSGLTYTGSGTSILSGLGHLEGEPVVALATNASGQTRYFSGLFPSGGAVTLPGGFLAVKAHVGISYEAKAETLELDVGGRDGSMVGRRKKVSSVIFSLLETELQQLAIRSKIRGAFENVRLPTNAASSPNLTVYTGNLTARIDDSWGGMGKVEISHLGPTPCTIRAMTPIYESEP